jgi:two-component system OmpR family sensor kinase
VNRIFFRFFMLVMLSITAATFVIYFAMSRLFGDPLEDIARRQASAQIFLIEQYVDEAPRDEWLVRLNRVREVSDTRFDLIMLNKARSLLPATSLEALDRGEVVLDVEGKAFFRRVDLKGERYIGSEEEVIHAQDLPIDMGLALQMEVVRYVIVALALLVPILLWSRSHWQGLQSLSRVADEFGAGKLSARARMQPSSSIYPLAERIDHMADRIEDLLVSQKNLLHSVSHELRTPIARLEFALELLDARANDPALRKRIAAMEGDVSELNTLVNELLGMARLDSGQALQRETVDVAGLLRAVEDALPPGDAALSVVCARDAGTIEADPRTWANSRWTAACWRAPCATCCAMRRSMRTAASCCRRRAPAPVSRSRSTTTAPAFPKTSARKCSTRSTGSTAAATARPAVSGWVCRSCARRCCCTAEPCMWRVRAWGERGSW